jgi:hypothetical protein
LYTKSLKTVLFYNRFSCEKISGFEHVDRLLVFAFINYFSIRFVMTDEFRVMGEFSPLGRLFTWGSVLEITEKAQFFWAAYFHGISCVLILT